MPRRLACALGSVRIADSPQELLQQAIHAFSQGDLATAEGLSDRLVALAPRDVNAWLLRGRVAGRSGRWKRAEEALDRAAKLAPREGEVPFARAMIRMKQGRFAAAAELLEKMIASHPLGAGGGETDAFLAQLARFEGDPDPRRRWPELAASLSTADLDLIASGYLEHTDAFVVGGVERVADKQLQNWLFAGLFAAAFPDATIVHIRRDPFDTGLSCFERLVPAAMPWCCDLAHVGQMLAIHEWMMVHWHSVLPGRMVEIRYESLVREPEATLRPLLEATGLAWDDACVRQHERKHAGLREPPPTLSADQVKRPVYDTSIGRAERFGAALEPMRVAYRSMRRELGLDPAASGRP